MKKKIKRKKIGVLMGGTSAERDVSLKSGAAIYHALKTRGYHVVAIDVKEDLCVVLKKAKIEIAFLALHGGHGENGAMQGMLEVMGIPYTGAGVLASALAMDKEASKKLFDYHGIPVPPFKIVKKSEGFGELSLSVRSQNYSVRTGFPLPWVVKPVSEGSSVGVNIVKKKSLVQKALREAFRYGETAIIEKYIAGKEIQIGILHNCAIGGVEVRPSLEFYNYKAKYTSGLTEYILPPQIGKKTYEKCEQIALSAHKALGCRGATRVDLRVEQHGRPYVLEVNTIPGMTETSLLPKIAKQSGLEFPVLLEKILEDVING
jgi:D-alanine-D-alanine ligase